MHYDLIIIGGSYAGMAAALQLVRAHRSVLIIDGGAPRNRLARASHGFLGQDGVPPGDIAQAARAQLEAYPTLTWAEGFAERAEGERDRFTITMRDGAQHHGRRLLFAIGVSDTLPAVEGVAERWGRSIFHCPYCHGYELQHGGIGCIAVGPTSLHQALILPEWGSVTLLLNGAFTPDDAQREQLAARNVAVEETPVAQIEGEADVRLTDGRLLPFAGLFMASRNAPATPVAATLGCILEETPFGTQIQVSPQKATSVSGAYACGDVARVPHSVSLAVGDGAWAGAQIHHSLIFESVVA